MLKYIHRSKSGGKHLDMRINSKTANDNILLLKSGLNIISHKERFSFFGSFTNFLKFFSIIKYRKISRN